METRRQGRKDQGQKHAFISYGGKLREIFQPIRSLKSKLQNLRIPLWFLYLRGENAFWSSYNLST